MLDAVEQIRVLERMTRGSHLHILPGGGLTLERLASFVQSTGVQCVHLGTAVRERNHVDGAVEEEKVKRARNILDGLFRTNADGGQR
ncbi:hypothetical protein D3C85_1424900 [compost metagenome]